MTTQGDPHPIPEGADDGQEHGQESGLGHSQVRHPQAGRAGRVGRRAAALRILGWGAAALAVGAVGFVVTRPTPGDWVPGLGPSSKDADRTPPVVGTPPPTSAADPNPFTVDRYFPVARPIDLNGYHGKRSGVRQGSDCAETLQDRTRNPFQATNCQGYLTVSFSRTDGHVLSSVTILRFGDDVTSQRVADQLNATPGLLAFMQPDATIAAPSPVADPQHRKPVARAEAVHHYVTVATSRYADGTSGTAATPDQQLVDATWATSYTASAAFLWG
ncbi:hypothetical protein P3T37_007037 [Kitasatospora sp. MAA4]|uniref:hypothetical protein n=1 Tax=Kitasatospora sp. MAA4 TaxID=3035093 RepID=UPI002476412A|nr:hypothetical protein [Kitasatospora sp. MAA4]MDH6137604.1 hypothetical protein [Kitasatospora sp. MAA4]